VLPATAAPTTAAPTTTTIPETLAFVALFAEDDHLAVSDQSAVLNVLSNDRGSGTPRLVTVEQPRFGSARITDDDLIEVTLPRSFAGSVTFGYEIADETGATSMATVVIESINVLGTIDQIVGDSDDELTSAAGLLNRAEVLFGSLITLRLSTLQLTVMSFAPLVTGFLAWSLRRRDQLVSITQIQRGERIGREPGQEGTTTSLRHDALVWTSARTRKQRGKSQTLVELPGGHDAWIPTSNIINTGY